MRYARCVAVFFTAFMAPALAFAQPAQPVQPAAKPPTAPSATSPTPAAAPAADPKNDPYAEPLVPTGSAAPSAAALAVTAAPPAVAPKDPDPNHGPEAVRGEIGARPTDVYAEDWWNLARPIFEIHGYFRTRAELFHNFSLGRTDTEDRTLWPVPTDSAYTPWNGSSTSSSANAAFCGGAASPNTLQCTDKSQASANLRFRLNPELHISDNVRILSQIDLLDNLVMGSTPEGYANQPSSAGYQRVSPTNYVPMGSSSQTAVAPTSGVNSYQNSIVVKRVWGEYVTPVGQIRFGRMPSHWGLGMLDNSGDTFDSDYQTTIDRFQFVSGIKALDLYVSGSWDFVNEGPIANSLQSLQGGQAYDKAQMDDVNQYTMSVVRRRAPALERLDLAQGKVVLNAGAYVQYRNQFLAADDASAKLNATNDEVRASYTRRGMHTWTPDLWLQLKYKKFRFEAEGVMINGSMENSLTTGGDKTDFTNSRDTNKNGWNIRQFGLATQTEFKAVEDRLRLNFGFGWSSGDPDVQGLSSSKQLTSNRTFSTFRFNPNYRVDLIFFRNIMSRVQGAYYFRPSVDYDFSHNPNGQRLGGGAAVIWSRASEFVQAPGHKRDLGVEIDLSLYFQSKDGSLNDDGSKMGGFFTMLQYGVFFPMGGLDYLPNEKTVAGNSGLTLDTSAAQTLRWFGGIFF